MTKTIYVYFLNEDKPIGIVYLDDIKGKEIYSFSYTDYAIENNLYNVLLDDEILFVRGRQYKNDSSTPYHFLLDSAPDRWGKNLIKRALGKKNISFSDFLINVSDYSRMGALRYKTNIDGPFELQAQNVPPYKFLRELENVAYNYDEFIEDDEWKALLSPGSSLGGARPKATIYDNNKELYIAKFAHKQDDYDISKVEYLTYRLAKDVGIYFSPSKLIEIAPNRSVFLTKRFDRENGERIHYVSFMTLLNTDEGESSNYSYLDIAECIAKYSDNPTEDLKELFKRVAFYIFVHNYDDHLRNIGMIYRNGRYRLAPCFDANITLYNSHLTVSIDGTSDISLEKLLECSLFFKTNLEEGKAIIEEMKATLSKSFKRIAKEIHLDNSIYNQIAKFLDLSKTYE